MKITKGILEEAARIYLTGCSLEETKEIVFKKYGIKVSRETLRKRLVEMGIAQKRKSMVKIGNDFEITIPPVLLKKLNLKSGHYLKVKVEKNSKEAHVYIKIPKKPKSRKNAQVKKKLPKEIIEILSLSEGEMIRIKEITKVEKPVVEKPIKNNLFDLAYVASSMMCESFMKNNEEFLRLWYVNRGNALSKRIEIKRFIPMNREVAEFFGLLQAEGSKKNNKVSFTNSIIDEHKKIVKAAEDYLGISKENWKVCIYYNPNLVNKQQVRNIGKQFLNKIDLMNKKVGFVKHEGLTKVNFQIYISSKILNIIINNSLKLLRKITIGKFVEFCKGFILKVLVGDGTAILSKNLKNLEIMVSEVDEDAQKDLINMLESLGIYACAYKNSINISTDFYSCLWFLENNIFDTHEENRKKFLTYVANNYYFNILYKRLKSIKNIVTIREFAKRNSLSEKSAERYLSRNFKRGFVKKIGRGLYATSKVGKSFLNLYEKALLELSTFYNT